MQRRAAIAAEFRPHVIHAQPVPASLAIRIDALHRPARQILHSRPLFPRSCPLQAGSLRATRKICAECAAGDLWCQAKRAN